MQPKLPDEIIKALPEWKGLYGDVFLTQTSTGILVYRGLTFAEVFAYNEILKRDPTAAEDFILHRVTLYPTDLKVDDLPPVFVQKLIATITETSAVNSPEAFSEHLAKGREYASSLEGFATGFIAHALHIPTEQIRNMTIPILARHIAMAETVLGKEFTFSDGTEKKPKAAGNGVKPSRDQMVASMMDLRRQQQGRRGAQQSPLPPLQLPTAPPPIDPRAVPQSNMNFAADNAALRDFGFGGE